MFSFRTPNRVEMACAICFALCGPLLVGLSQMGYQKLDGTLQVYAMQAVGFFAMFTGAFYVSKETYADWLSSLQKDKRAGKPSPVWHWALAARLCAVCVTILAIVAVTSALDARMDSLSTPEQKEAQTAQQGIWTEIHLRVAHISAGVDNGTHVPRPLFIIAGFSSSTLLRFGRAVWGVLWAFPFILFQQDKWLEMFTLSASDGLLLPKGGQYGLDYVFGLGLWRKAMLVLRACGYNDSNIHASTYDFRPGPHELQRRARYFADLQALIEKRVNETGQTAAILSHSYGDTLVRWFYQWVESEQGGRGGPDWVNRYIGYDYSQGAVTAGTPKALLAMITGQSNEFFDADRSMLNGMPLLKPSRRAQMFRSFGSVATSVPSGGNLLWGQDGAQQLITFAHDYDKDGNYVTANTSRGEFASIFQPLQEVSESAYNMTMNTFKGALQPDLLSRSSQHMEMWASLVGSQLPHAPNLRKIVVYGQGKKTEVGYVLKKEGEGYALDTSVHFPEKGIYHGIRYDDGDGTVPLVSLGMGCVKVTCREISSKENFFDPTDHVFSANPSTILDILKIVSGNGHEVSGHDIFESDIKQRAEKLHKRMGTGDFSVPASMSGAPAAAPNQTAEAHGAREGASINVMHGEAEMSTRNVTGRVYRETQSMASGAPSVTPSTHTPTHNPVQLPTASWSTSTKRATQAKDRKDPALLEALTSIREMMTKGGSATRGLPTPSHDGAQKGATIQANGSSQQQPKKALHPELVDALRHAIAVMKPSGVAIGAATPRPSPIHLIRDVAMPLIARPPAFATQEDAHVPPACPGVPARGPPEEKHRRYITEGGVPFTGRVVPRTWDPESKNEAGNEACLT